MSGIPNSSKEAKRLRLLDELPQHDWSWFKAGVAAGYSEQYALKSLKNTCLKDEKFTRALLAKKREMDAQGIDQREKTEQFLQNVRDDTSASTRDRIAAAKELGAISGWHSEKIILETSARQRQMDEAARRAAQEASRLLTNTRLLPDGTTVPLPPIDVAQIIDSEPVPAEPGDTH